jgi:hypothetical protein
MQDPATPHQHKISCPACNSPVNPGDKFCEACGEKIPVLFTCTKCGTQFIHAKEYCELCGGPLVPGDGPVPGTPEKPAHDDKTITGKRPVPEPSAEEPPEQSVYESPEEEREAEVIPVKKKVSRRYTEPEEEPEQEEEPEDTPVEERRPTRKKAQKRPPQEIEEPDTAELLELYGKEYDPDETLESHRKSPGTSRKKTEAKRPAAAPLPPARGSAAKVDDALLLSPDRPETPAPKRRAGRGKKIPLWGLVLIVVVAAVLFIGLPLLAETNGEDTQSSVTLVEESPVPGAAGTGTAAPVITPAPTRTYGALVPQPTQTVPTGQKLYFQVQKSPITARILVTFAGSAGHGSIKSADIRVTHPDGSVATGMILPLKGITEIILDGSTGTDRVEILALMSDGGTYRVYDELVPMMT